MRTVICDLDGTIALDTGRAKECLHSGKRDWDAYYARVSEDKPNVNLIRVLKALWLNGNEIAIISGRRADTRKETIKWLDDYEVPYISLDLRPMGNFIDDHILKPQMASELGLYPDKVLVVFEDRDRVVKVWRALGYSCFQVASGDF